MSKYTQRRCLSLGFRCRRLVACAITLSALLCGIAAPRVHAQTTWDGTVEVSPSTLTIKEGESATYRVRLTKPPTEDADQNWWVLMHVDGARRSDGHYKSISWIPSIGREFNRDNWDQWKDIRIYAEHDDDAQDLSVTFTHEVWDHNGVCPVHNVGSVTVHVIDDDDGGGGSLPTLSIADAAVGEGGTGRFAVTLSRASTETVTVDFQTSDGTAKAGSDYTTKTGTLTFLAGQTTTTVSVSTVDDDAQEETEAFTVALSNPTGATLDDDTGTGTITDDDEGAGGTPPALSIADAAAVEEGGTAEFAVTLSRASTETVTVDFQTSDGTAKAGSDYTTKTGTLTFLAGQTTTTVSVSTVDDDAQEETEAFTVALSNPTGATLDDDTGTGTITDDDEGAGGTPPALSIADAAAVEEGGTAEFAVTLSRASTETVTVDFQTSDGTAKAGSDYTTKTGTLTFLAGQTTTTVSVSTVDDDVQEETEAFTVALSNPTGATLDDDTGTGTITDDDEGAGGTGQTTPALSIADADTGTGTITDDDEGAGGTPPALSIADAAAVEEGGTAEFAVTLSRASTETVTVDFQTSDGTAKAGSDYTTKTGTLTFLAGQTTTTVSVSTVDDDAQEETEAFTVALSNPTGATLDDDTGTGTITDDDEGAGGTPPALSIADAAAVEEGGTAEFAVTLSRASTETVTVDFQTSDGTAKAGSDYTTKTGTLTFLRGKRRRRDSVSTVDDFPDKRRRTGDARGLHGGPEQPDRGDAGRRHRDGDDHRRRRGRGRHTSGAVDRGRGGGGRGGHGRVRGDVEPGQHRDGDGGLPDVGRDGQGWLGLHDEDGYADFPGGANDDDGLGVDRGR